MSDFNKQKDSTAMEKNSGSSVGMGGVNTGTISSTDNSNTTIINNNTTVEKDVAEKLIERRRVYRSRCKELYYDGFITDEGLKELEEFRCSLDLDPTIAFAIRDEVKVLSVKIRTELPLAGKIKLENLQIAISQNNIDTIFNIVPELEGWMERVKSSELCSMYYQLNSILYPGKYIKILLSNTAEEYWKTYWSYVAYSLQGLNAKAEASLAELTAWDSFYPQQNQVLLLVIGYLMKNDLMSARLAYSRLSTGISVELTSVKNAISELLETDYSSKSIVGMSGGTSFYAHNLFPRFIENIDCRIKENKARQIEDEAEQQRLQNQIRRQKESILQKFQETGHIEKACQEVGVAYHTFNIWLEEDSIFKASYDDLVNYMKIKKFEELEKKRKEDEFEFQTKRKKSDFKTLFEKNKCDLLKTCSDLGISSADYQEWHRTDSVFSDDIAYIIRKNNEIIEKQNQQKRAEIIRKVRPFVVIALVIGIIAISINVYLTTKESKAKVEITQLYENKINDFNGAYDLIDSSPDGLEALSNAYAIVEEMREMEKSEYLLNANESLILIDKLQLKSEELLDIFKKRVTLPEDSGGNKIMWEDGRKGVEKIKELQKSVVFTK